MKRRSLLASSALLAVAAGLLTAAPSQAAAVSLPAGCTTQSSGATSPAQVTDLTCKNLSDNVDLARYTALTSLQIGSYEPEAPAVTLTKLPKLPAGLTYVSIIANKVTDLTALSPLRKLQWLTVQGSTVHDLVSVGKNTKLVWLDLNGPGYWGKDLSALAQLPNLEELSVQGSSPVRVSANEGARTPGGFGRGLDGKYLLPVNDAFVDENGKPTGRYAYDFNAADGTVVYNSGSKQLHSAKIRTVPKIRTLPKLKKINVDVSRFIDVASLADWSREKENTLVVSGARKVGGTLSVRHKLGGGMREHADKFQWKRDGKAIPGATGRSYKITAADRGHRITVTGTDSVNSGFGALFRTIPYSQTVLAAVPS